MNAVASVPVLRRTLTPSRLRLARQLRGLSQTALAKEVGVSPAAINQFESGRAHPAPETFELLAVCLKVAPAYLARPATELDGQPFFRSLARVPAAERDKASAYAEALTDIVSEFERHVDLPALRIGRLATADETADDDEIEAAAMRARATWGIPPGPLANVVAMAEARGVVVAAVGEFHEGIDAFSAPTHGRPIVVLCSQKGSAMRRRFDMAHELGHLTLHTQRDDRPQWQERQAHRFASALLMPADEVLHSLPRSDDDLRSLERTARTWGVSMQAALMRARDLRLLDAEGVSRTMRRLSRAGWRTKEPVEAGPAERPQLLLAASAALEDAGTSLEALAERIGLPAGRLARMLRLPESRNDASGGKVVALRPNT